MMHRVLNMHKALTMRELRHWPSIAGLSPQNHCGDEEDGRIELYS